MPVQREWLIPACPSRTGCASEGRPGPRAHPGAASTGETYGPEPSAYLDGAVIARRLAADGHPVAVNYWAGAEAARELVADIRAAGGTAEAFAADVTDEADVTDLVTDVTARLGPVATSS
ncbi:SDR family NAD(P)-dependent oxidoreductase [Streptomyces sp. A30]|uniref:SDR family NAD(P)-dependent oxidoreductase n=1 Tax=Streptomyces sp. A30 TaxID=2789273 RepID=UPI003980C1B5